MAEKKGGKRPIYNSNVLAAMSAEFSVSEYYIRKAVRGEVPSATGDMLKKKYNELLREYNELIRGVDKTLKAKSKL